MHHTSLHKLNLFRVVKQKILLCNYTYIVCILPPWQEMRELTKEHQAQDKKALKKRYTRGQQH